MDGSYVEKLENVDVKSFANEVYFFWYTKKNLNSSIKKDVYFQKLSAENKNLKDRVSFLQSLYSSEIQKLSNKNNQLVEMIGLEKREYDFIFKQNIDLIDRIEKMNRGAEKRSGIDKKVISENNVLTTKDMKIQCKYLELFAFDTKDKHNIKFELFKEKKIYFFHILLYSEKCYPFKIDIENKIIVGLNLGESFYDFFQMFLLNIKKEHPGEWK